LFATGLPDTSKIRLYLDKREFAHTFASADTCFLPDIGEGARFATEAGTYAEQEELQHSKQRRLVN